MLERETQVATRDGSPETFIVHPDRGGPFPVVVFLMDAPGVREELRDMARRFATSGFYVMLPNLYHREGVKELGPLSPDPEHPSRKRMYELMNGLDIPKVMDDVAGLVAFAEADLQADAMQIGTVGYCMSGRYAIGAAQRWPDRVRAAASIYGTRLVTEADDSPHRVAAKVPADVYFACAERDHWAPPEMVAQLQKDLAGTRCEVEIYPDTDHGFAFPGRPLYRKLAAEQHWERVLSLYRRTLLW